MVESRTPPDGMPTAFGDIFLDGAREVGGVLEGGGDVCGAGYGGAVYEACGIEDGVRCPEGGFGRGF